MSSALKILTSSINDQSQAWEDGAGRLAQGHLLRQRGLRTNTAPDAVEAWLCKAAEAPTLHAETHVLERDYISLYLGNCAHLAKISSGSSGLPLTTKQ